MDLRAWTLLLSLALIWGLSFYLMAVALRELPVLTIVFLRVSFAALTLWAVVAITRTKVPTKPAIWISFLVMGLLNNAIPFTLIVWGQQHIASGLAAILIATTPLFTLLLAWGFLQDEAIGKRKLLGVGIGFIGVVFLVAPDIVEGFSASLTGQLAMLGAAISYGLSGTYGRRFKKLGVNPLVTAAGQVSGSTLLLLPVTLLFNQGIAMPGLTVATAIITLAVLCTAIAYLLYFKILETSGASNLSLVTLIVPAIAVLLGTLLLDERLQASQLIGMLIIGIGMAVIDGRLTTRKLVSSR